MIKQVYALFDKKAGIYYDPTFQPYESDDMKELYRRTVLSGHIPNSEDLELYRLGTYDDKDAKFSTLDRPLFVCYLGEFSNGSDRKEITQPAA